VLDKVKPVPTKSKHGMEPNMWGGKKVAETLNTELNCKARGRDQIANFWLHASYRNS
jgi:hypothetical protein